MLEQLFNELFREYEQRLYAFTVKIVKSDAQAKDILQDVFMKLWMIRGRLQEIDNIGAFLYRLTENKIFDYLRAAASRKKARQLLWEYLQRLNREDNCLEMKEYHDIIRRAIDHLPPQRKAIYLLSKVEGHKRREIAAELKISPNTVRNQLAAALRYIHQYVKQRFS